jgi:short-chain fatty acids transporter
VSDTALSLEAQERPSLLSRFTAFFVYLFERLIPDPYVFAVILTFVGALLALILAPNGSPKNILSSWYGGVFGILTFAFQMVMMLVTGYALASAPIIASALSRIASIPKDAKSAVSLTVAVAMIASWLNWGLGLVVSALLAREIAKRVEVDFGWLVAAAYTGFVVSTEGLSGSIALSQATHGSALNIVEKVTGQLTPLSQTVFTRFNLIPVLMLFFVLPLIFRFLGPPSAKVRIADPERLRAEDQLQKGKEKTGTLGSKLDHAWILNLLLVAFGGSALGIQWWRDGFSLDLNSVITMLLLAGLLLHWTPAAYISAVQRAARVTGSLILQYPLYGGLMGIMTGTRLAEVLAKAFLRFSTAHTLPFWTYFTSLIITFFVPSGGGHWAVQGPFIVPAARDLHASLAGTTMAVAMGESVANMLQPFWALPILAIAGIPMRRMMGFMVITFAIALLIFGTSLLLLVPGVH